MRRSFSFVKKICGFCLWIFGAMLVENVKAALSESFSFNKVLSFAQINPFPTLHVNLNPTFFYFSFRYPCVFSENVFSESVFSESVLSKSIFSIIQALMLKSYKWDGMRNL